ncbi:MAG: PAS domain S-box protein [Alphaproteobacteria bacterium]|nr:PAS domain S-box protein [Alphaproteobacteria bacterium]
MTKPISLGAGALVLLAGLLVLIGWHIHSPEMVQLSPDLVPMQYNTALGFLLGGAGLIALSESRPGLTQALGLVMALIGTVTLAEYGLGVDLGIDEMFMTSYITEATSHPGRMAPNTALCFLLSGTGMAVSGASRFFSRRRAVQGLLGALTASLGAVALSGYLVGMETAYGWGNLTRMAVHTSAAFVVLGTGLIVHAWESDRAETNEMAGWLPAVVGICLLTVAIALWQALSANEQFLIRRYGTEADFLAEELVLLYGVAAAAAAYWAMSKAQSAHRAAQAAQAEVAERRLAEQRLAESEARFRTYFEMGMVGFAETSIEKGWVRVNDELCRMLGYDHGEIVTLTWAELTHPEDLAPDVAQFERLLAGEVDGYSMEKRFLRKDGEVVHTIMSARLRRKPDGSPDYLFAVLQDISALKKMEEQIRQSNAELEQFAYVASHDLQEPLRSVTSYAQLLERGYGQVLDAEGREFLGFIVGGAKRAGALIRGLLAFSRVAPETETPVPTDCAGVVKSVLLDLGPALREADAVVDIGPLPKVMAAPDPLARVFLNLIGNAIKYRAPGRRPEIRVSAEYRRHEWLFAVKDNGIGFDPQYSEQIFMIFKRLHSRTAYEGTGIGLAICKRVVERLGGRIWVESSPGEGATFRFTLRAAEPPTEPVRPHTPPRPSTT